MKKTTKTANLQVRLWRGSHGTGIHLAADQPTFKVVVRKNGAKKSGHPALWRELDKYLKQQKKEPKK